MCKCVEMFNGSLRIVAGSQTGVEKGAYEVALARGFDYTDLTAEEEARLLDFVNYEEPWEDPDMGEAERNVLKSDATLILTMSDDLEGSALETKNLCENHEKPYFVVNLMRKGFMDFSTQKDVLDWVSNEVDSSFVKLNVTGPTESECVGAQGLAREFVSKMLDFLPVSQLCTVLARTVKPGELDEAVDWATQSGEDEESVRPFIEWAERYGPTTALEVAQMSFHLVKPGVWREPTRYEQAMFWEDSTPVVE